MASPSDRPLIAPTTGAPYPPAPPVVAHHPPSQPHHHLLPPQQYQRLSPTHAARADQVTHPHQVFAHYTTMHQQQQQQGQQGHPQYQQQSQQQYSPSYPPQQGGVHVQPMQGSSYPPQLTQQPQHPHHLPPPAQYSSGGYSYPSHHPQQQQPGPTTQQHYPHRQQPQHHHQHHQQAYPDYPRPAFPYDYLSDGSGQRVGSGGERQPPYDPIERRAGGHDTVGEPRPPAHLLREFQPGRQITITRETIRPTYEAFIKAFHNEPTDKCSVEEHVVKFMQPPRNQKRSFMPFDLFELVKFYGGVDKLRSWSDIARSLGFHRRGTNIAVRIKDWLTWHHIDAYFDYLLGIPNSFFITLPDSHPSHSGASPFPNPRTRESRRSSAQSDESGGGGGGGGRATKRARRGSLEHSSAMRVRELLSSSNGSPRRRVSRRRSSTRESADEEGGGRHDGYADTHIRVTPRTASLEESESGSEEVGRESGRESGPQGLAAMVFNQVVEGLEGRKEGGGGGEGRTDGGGAVQRLGSVRSEGSADGDEEQQHEDTAAGMEWDQADPAREKGKQPAAVNADDDDRHSARIPPSPAQRHRSLTSNTIHPPSPTRTETSPSRLPGSDGAGSFPFTASETPQPAPRSNSDPFPFPLRTTIPLRRPHLAAELNVVDDQMDVVAPANPFFDDFVESARPESGASSTAGAPSEGRKEVPAVPQETSSGSSGDSSFPAPPTAPAPTSTTTTTTTTEPHQPLPPTLPPPRNTSGSSITTAATETTESTLLASINPDQPSRNTTGGTTTTTISTVSNPSFTRPPNNPPNNATSHPPVVDMPTLQAQNGALAARNEFLERRCRELAGLLGECNEMVRHMRGELAALKGVVGRVRELRALLEGLCGELAGEAGLAGL